MSQLDELFVVHHCHTDVGYTHDQPVVWDLQRRFTERAIDLAKRDLDYPDGEAFRWTVETTEPLLRWLQVADDERIAQFRALEERGRIEVTGMLGNLTPLCDQTELVESLRPLRRLREEHGFEIRTAMNGDVNGHNWPLVDRLLDAGIDGFSMAVNRHWRGAPVERPLAFRWEGPSGRTLRTFNAFQYGGGYNMGIGRDAEALAGRWLPHLDALLDRIDYPLPILMIQTTHPFFDNNPPLAELPAFVREWNDRPDVADRELPSLRVATPTEWWKAVDACDAELPVYRGDWTDHWNFGSISSAHETAMTRESRRRLRTADAMEAALTAAGTGREDRSPARRSGPDERERAWRAVAMYDEHTWGADISVEQPESEDTRSQWHHKAKHAYDARSRSLLLRRDAVAEFARRVADAGGNR